MTLGPSARPEWRSAAFTEELSALRTRLEELTGAPAAPDPFELTQDLSTAYEELRVADEEIRSQQEHILGLLTDQRRLAQQHERLFALIPVPVLTTDRAGVVRTANAAAAALLGLGLTRLVGKPIATFVTPEERPALRQRLALHSPEAGGLRHTVTLRSRDGRELRVEAVASVLPGEPVELSWMLLASGNERPGGAPSALPEALVGLAALGTEVGDLRGLASAATQICQDVLGPEVAVSIALGDPASPEVLATSSTTAQEADGAQVVAGEGPCATAYATGATVLSENLAADPRWPRLQDRLPDEVQGAVCAALEVGEAVVGALNVYTASTVPLEELVDSVALLAAAVGTAVHELRVGEELRSVADHLEAALASRGVIDQAKGIVMADKRCTAEEAFQHLVDISSSSHVKVREVAQGIVDRVTGGGTRGRP